MSPSSIFVIPVGMYIHDCNSGCHIYLSEEGEVSLPTNFVL